jgi:hypothetical protein
MEVSILKHVKLVSFAVCAALVLALSGCTIKSPATVMTVDGTDIPAGLYLTYQLEAYNSAYSKVEDKTNVLGGEIDGVKATEWIHSETVKKAQKYVYVAKAYDDAKLTMSDDDLATFQDTVDSAYEQNGDWLASNGIGKESYYEYALSASKENALYEAYAEDNTPTDSEIKAYMNENYCHVNILYLPTTDTSYAALADDVIASIKEKAQKMVDDINGGKEFADVAEDTLKAAFELGGREYADDTLSSYSTNTFVKSDSTSYSEAVLKQLFDAKAGTAFLNEEATMPTIINKVENFATDADFENYRDGVSSEMTYADFEAATKAEAEKLSTTENSSAVSTYSPKKIKTA